MRYCEVEGCGLPVPDGTGTSCTQCGRLICDHCHRAEVPDAVLCPKCAAAVGIELPFG